MRSTVISNITNKAVFLDWDSNPATTFAGLYVFLISKKRVRTNISIFYN